MVDGGGRWRWQSMAIPECRQRRGTRLVPERDTFQLVELPRTAGAGENVIVPYLFVQRTISGSHGHCPSPGVTEWLLVPDSYDYGETLEQELKLSRPRGHCGWR